MTLRLVVAFVALVFVPQVVHGQSYLRNSLSVRPVPGLGFDAYVESISRGGSKDTIISELSALPSGGKARPGEAVLLAMLLNETGRAAEALTVLRQNAQRHPADRMSLSALAHSFRAGRYSDDEEAVLRQLYELPAPPHARLECLRQLAMVMQENGRLRELRDAMVKKLKEEPNDAYGWLELGVVQARAGEEEESRRCLYKAAKLRPKDVQLRLEIARREAGFGLLTEALRTLGEVDKLEKSASTKLLRCQVRLDCGEETRTLAALEGFTPPPDADAELVLVTADALARSHAWSAAAHLLDQALVAHATNYQMQYLRAAALEEMGDHEAAVTAFMALITQAAEMPADESPWFGGRFRGDLHGRFLHPMHNDDSWKGLALPPGTLGIIHSRMARMSAYIYRRNSIGYSACYAFTQVEDAPPAAFIALPETLLDAKHLAVAHLQQLLPRVGAARRAEAEKTLVTGGLEQPEVLLDPAGIEAPGVLSRHPRVLALHAARLLDAVYGDRLPLEVLDAEVELFRESFPQLAFLAACRAYHAAAALEAGMPALAAQKDSAAARRVLALKLADQIPSSPQSITALLGLLPSSDGQTSENSGVAASAEELRILARAVDLALQVPAMSPDERAAVVIPIIRADIRMNDLEEAIRLMRAFAKTSAPAVAAPPGLPPVVSADASLPEPLTELGITHPVLAAVAAQGAWWENARRSRDESAMATVHARLAQVYETDARLTLELCLGDFSEIEEEMKRRFAQPHPTLADHMLAAWLARVRKDTVDALKHLAAASALARDAGQLRSIDKYVLHSIDRPTGKLSDPLRTFVIASIQRLQVVELHPASTERAHRALSTIGTPEEVEKIAESERQAQLARFAKADLSPYSRNAAYNQQQARFTEATQRMIDVLKARNLPAIAEVGRSWSWSRADGGTYSREEMENLLGGPEALKLLLQAIKPDADSGEAELLRYADTLINYGDEAAALEMYIEMAKRDLNAIRPRVYAAACLVEKAPATALVYLRSIRLQSVVASDYDGSPLAMLVNEYEPAAHRAAVARLITRWINSTENAADLAPLLNQSICSSLIQMTRHGAADEPRRFPPLNQSSDHPDYFTVEGANAEAMREARQAHDDLCRALLRLPEAQPSALAALASLVIHDGGDLSECAQHAAALLRDPQAWAPLRSWLNLVGGGGELFAGPGSIAVPSPMTILVRSAAQKKDFRSFETEFLPLIDQALGSPAATGARLYARLFSAPEPDYPAAAVAWLATRPREKHPPVKSLNEVLNVWQWRALRVDLSETLLKSDLARAELKRGAVPETLTSYLTLLVKAKRQDEAITCVKMLRDLMISSDPAVRQRLIKAWHAKLARHRSTDPEETTSYVSNFSAWLKSSLRDPTLFCLLPLALEEGLLCGPYEFAPVARELVTSEMLRSPEAIIALAENLGFLADAPGWRNYILSPCGEPNTWISSLTEQLREFRISNWMGSEKRVPPLRPLLAARQPQTLGSEIFAALLALSRTQVIQHGLDLDKRDERLREVLTRRQAELAAIPPAQRRAFSLLLRKELPDYPDVSKLDAGLARALQPFLAAEADDLVPELDRLLAATEWADVGMKVDAFYWQYPALLAQAARRHPAKVEQVVLHVCELMRKTPEDEQQRFFGVSVTPVAKFIQSLAQVPQLLGTCMHLAESEKLQLDAAWTEGFASKLTDHPIAPSREHIAAIFTRSPLVADAEHFNDFVVSTGRNSAGTTLLVKVINAVKRDDQDAQWLQQRLLAEPEQTFGIQLTLALLKSTACVRRAQDEDYRSSSGPAPLVAFAAAHARDFLHLSPSAVAALRTIFVSYLTPPAFIPYRAGVQPEPFRIPPPLK